MRSIHYAGAEPDAKRASTHMPVRRLAATLAALYPLALVALSILHVAYPQRDGLLALSQVFAPYLFLPLLAIWPLAFVPGAITLRVALVLCAFIFIAQFPPRLHAAAPPATPSAIQLDIMSWNVHYGGDMGQIREVLLKKPAGIVGITEADRAAVESDPHLQSIYPYRVGVQEGNTTSGQVLLSVYPILEQGIVTEPPGLWDVPKVVWARLEVGLGKSLVAVLAHPSPAVICGKTYLPTCYDTEVRDNRLAYIRAMLEPYLQAGDAVVLFGDFNVTEREPAYRDLSAGLTDAHRAVGLGTGNTWRPSPLIDKELPLLRIDYIFTGPGVTPLSIRTDCTPRGSDHCILHGRIELK